MCRIKSFKLWVKIMLIFLSKIDIRLANLLNKERIKSELFYNLFIFYLICT